jgi:2-polyprenyl-3-methyl-5-hydroxy-6-metoxy-1,4-benzoquinol methylase
VFVQVRAPKDSTEFDRIWAFRYATYVRDRRKGSYKLDHERKWIKDGLDDCARHLIAVDREGNVVGCLRTNFSHETVSPDYLQEWMRYARLTEVLGEGGFTYSSQLMVEPSLRGRTVASLLALAQIRDGIRSDAVADTCCCELNLVHVYYSLGYRPYAPAFRIAGTGMRVPLILCARDREYLDRIESPFRQFVDSRLDDGGETARKMAAAFPDFIDPSFSPPGQRTTWAILAAGPGSEPEDPISVLFEGTSEARLQELIGTPGKVRFRAGDRLYEMGEIERSSGLVLSGRLGVHMATGDTPHYIAVLGAGEVFGEMLSLGLVGRSAHLTALEDTEVLLLPPDLVDRLGRKDPELGFRVARNLCEVLARRLATADEVIARHLTATRAVATSRSYDRKEDDHVELQRLDVQASAMVEKEVGLLRQLGLKEGMRVLDVGCGGGGLATAIAGSVPGTTVLGIDPNEVMVRRASALAEKRGVTNCRFEAGSALAIPVDDRSQEFVTCRLVLQHLSDPHGAVREMARVLAPGGTMVLIDADDGGIMIHPEPPGFHYVISAVESIKAAMGANRKVGRELAGLLEEAGLAQVKVQVLPIHSREISSALLAELAFSFRKRLLVDHGAWTAQAEDFFAALDQLPETPGSLIVVPVFVAAATMAR